MTSAKETVLRARHVLAGDGRAIENGWIRIARGRITALGSGRPSAAAVDLGDAVILAGLVNAHTHLEFSTLDRPFDAAAGLPAWIHRVVVWRRQRDGKAPMSWARRSSVSRPDSANGSTCRQRSRLSAGLAAATP